MFSICFAPTLLFLWILSSCSWWNILICSSLASRCQTIRLSSRNGVAGLVWLLLTSLCPATNLPCQKQEPSLLVPNRLCVFYWTRVRSLAMLVTYWLITHSLTHWLTHSCLVNLIDVTCGLWRCQLKTCWVCYCCWCWWWETFWRQFYAVLEAEVWS